jgi:hypothetical protein
MNILFATVGKTANSVNLILTEALSSYKRSQAQFVPHRKHYDSIINPNRLMLIRQTIAAYCKNHMKNTQIPILRGDCGVLRRLKRMTNSKYRGLKC